MKNKLDQFFDGTIDTSEWKSGDLMLIGLALRTDRRTYKNIARELSPAFDKAVSKMDGLLPETVSRDKWTQRLVKGAAAAYVLDIWSPLPVGEAVAAVFLGVAVVRSRVFGRELAEEPENKDELPKPHI